MTETRATRNYHFVRYFAADKGREPGTCEHLGPYTWLTRVPVSRMVCEALGLWRAVAAAPGGIDEVVPPAEFAAALRSSPLPSLDPIPRAGAVLAVIARRARKAVPETPQCALEWATYGTKAGQPRLGDIVCATGDDGARVGVYVGEDDAAYHALGATGDDRIGVARIGKAQLYAVRRPLYEGVQFAANGIRLNRDGTRPAA